MFVGAVAVLAVLGSVIALLLQRLLPAARHGAAGRALLRLCARCTLWVARRTAVLECDLDALHRLRDEPGLVLVANHPSRLDAVLLMACLPELVCVTKPSILALPLFGAAMRLAGSPRAGALRGLVGRSATQLRGGRQLLVFPEGTRSPPGGVGPFQPGFAALAQSAGAPVQTIVIETSSRFLGRDWPLLRRPAATVQYRVRLGPRFGPPAPGEARALAVAVERAVIGLAGPGEPAGHR